MSDEKASPFEFKFIDGEILQINKETGKTKSKTDFNDEHEICRVISRLDEELWETRSALSTVTNQYNEVCNDVQVLLDKHLGK